MILDDLMHAVRPVAFVSEHDEYPLWAQGGSVSVLKYREKYFIVTARHVLNPDSDLENLCVPSTTRSLSTESFRCMILNGMFTPNSTETDDTDFLDLCLLSIDFDECQDRDIDVGQYIDFEYFYREPSTLARGDRLVIIGIPSQDLNLNFGERLLQYRRFGCECTYSSLSLSRHCHLASINDDQPDSLASLDGFSGSLVFRKIEKPNKVISLGLVGLAIRGTVASGTVHFLGSDCLKEHLIRVRDGMD